MGSANYYVYVGRTMVYEGWGDVDGVLMAVFTDDERYVLGPQGRQEFAPFVPPSPDEDVGDLADDFDIEPDWYYVYQSEGRIVRDRLRVLNISEAWVRREFDMAYARHHRRVTAPPEGDDSHWPPRRSPELADDLEEYTFDRWRDLVHRAIGSGYGEDHRFDSLDVLGSQTFSAYRSVFGFPSDEADILHLLWASLEAVPDAMVTLHYTELVTHEVVGVDERLCELTHGIFGEEHVVVLTEGTTDTAILHAGVRLLYPHLAHMLVLADFSAVNAEGGAGRLVSYVKALASMRLKNVVLAVFDADTGARSALRGLQGRELPGNVRVMQLPHLALAERYPTIGPTGVSEFDINGLACSLELYLPPEVLRDEHGELHPVHWRGYDTTLRQYQGEIMGKAEIQSAFTAAVRDIDAGRAQLEDFTWDGLRAVFDEMLRVLAGEKT